jgi:predicted dehydrogenase
MDAEKGRPAAADSHSRRDFLKTAVAAAAVGAGGPLFPQSLKAQSTAPRQAPFLGSVLGANNRLTCAFIGVGGQGYHAHVGHVKEHSGDYNAVGAAVCDVWRNRTDRAREALGLASGNAYSDWQRVIDRRDIDVVFIGTVDHWHAPIAMAALRAGKHVYVEKPVTRYLGEAFSLYDVARETGNVVQIGSQYTSEGKWHKAAEMIRGGRIGKLVFAQDSYTRNNPLGEWNYDIEPDLTSDSCDWRAWLGPVRGKPFSPDHYFRWRKYYPYCAGILGDLLAHRIHPLMLATGSPEFPRRVTSLGTKAITPDRDVPDNVQVLAEFPSGLTMLVIGSTVNEQGLGQVIRGHEATLYFSGTRLELRPERPFADLADREEHPDVQPAVSVPVHIGNFFDAVRAGDPAKAHANMELGIRVQTVISMAEMSERLGEMLHFDEATRTIRTGSGMVVEPYNYETEPVG